MSSRINKTLLAGGVLLLLLCLPLFYWTHIHDRQQEDKAVILVGTHLPLTGALASLGLEQKWAYETSVEDVNRAGGIFVQDYGKRLPVQLVVRDDKTDPAKAALAVKSLIEEDQVELILSGHAASSGVIPGCIAAEKYHTYYHATASFSPPWLEHGFRWSTLLFFDIGQAASVPFHIWDALPANQRPERVALFMEDTFGGKAFGKAFREKAGLFGYNVVMHVAFDASSGDAASQILRAKTLGVDALLMHASVQDCLFIVQTMKAFDYHVKYLHGWKGTWSKEFWRSLGADGQYILTDGFWSADNEYPGSRALGDRYFAAFGTESISVGAFYATAQILWSAIEKAGSLDSEKVRTAVLFNRFDTVLGPIQYNSDGVGIYQSSAFQRRDSRLVAVYQNGLTNYALKMPPP